jgi:hypothetical protein
MMFYYDLVNFIVHIAFYVLICSSSDSSSSDSDSGKPRLVLFVPKLKNLDTFQINV